ncbi:MAG TPA: Holliday junction resolvase RuvX [Candidatus Paceibacterota bacterium]
MRYLGIDYGSKRIGLSISDEEGRMAFPHSVVENDSHALENISNIIIGNAVDTVVVGESKNFKGEANEIQKSIDKFAKALEAKEMELDIVFEPEFMTSSQAEKIQGKNNMLDASAATIILQSFLDRKLSN